MIKSFILGSSSNSSYIAVHEKNKDTNITQLGFIQYIPTNDEKKIRKAARFSDMLLNINPEQQFTLPLELVDIITGYL